MTGAIVVFLVITAVGLSGGLAITRYLHGLRAACAWLLWLALPFALLGIVAFAEAKPDGATHDDFAFGWALGSLLVSVPWLLGNVVGLVAGLIVRKR